MQFSVQFNGINITNVRYADDAVLASYSKPRLQAMLYKLNSTCHNYGMTINVKQFRVMVVCKRGNIKCQVALHNKTLEKCHDINIWKAGLYVMQDA